MATRASGGDPRLSGDREADVRPIVAKPSSGLPIWVIAAGVVIAAVLLFTILDGRRRSLSAPATKARASDLSGGAALQPAPLYVPPVPAPVVVQPLTAPAPPPSSVAPAQPRIVYVPQPGPPMQQQMPVPPTPPVVRNAADPVLVVDLGTAEPPAPAADPAASAGGIAGAGVRAGYMRNRATTVPQGALIPAVLETALDSTRPGLARALVQTDVRGFDGSKVLIQRGSRLIGEYKADLQPGQNRALVMWTRLVRPDGVTIALNSPAADPLGQVGIKGKVNSHFFQRFGAAILQSALDIGVNVASRSVGGKNSALVVALPGAVQNSTASLTNGAQIQPTLRVKQGTAIGVFVARDLDFTGVEGRR
ncbi:TrbI/VirB10 family protein [Sphingomonas sp. ERG5]|uniref:TrbI/VirB10 family protein n=1 Tax=Sphingomonas sp. ERG5 TaxID=1381597 RepID=UPI00068CA529|nr:TrbI/VirB10 family protein [Sphingomonas sp. ERG5]